MKQQTGLPTKITQPFGVNAASSLIRAVPNASQIGVTPGAASYADGFPPLTATALASGGVPPSIQDFNGLLNQMSAWDLWTAAAGITPYDSVFQAAIGGYPNGAVVYTATATVLGRVWVSIVDNNTTNPDAGGAGWLYIPLPADVLAIISAGVVGHSSKAFSSSSTWVVPAGIYYVRSDLWGGGGGGGGMGNNAAGGGGGGGAGGYAWGWFPVTPGNTLTITVAAGGGGGAAGGNSGTAGGTTTVTGFNAGLSISASGGQPGSGFTSGTGGGGGGGGASTSAADGSTGSAGQNGLQVGSVYLGGAGGGVTGGGAPTFNAAGVGPAGNFPAGGGGGGNQNQAGGGGAAGKVLLTW